MGVGEGVREFPALFRKLKEVSWFPKKGSDCDHLWIKLFIENVVLRLYKREKLQNVSLCSLFFLCSWRNVYWIALILQNLPCPEMFLVGCLHSGIILFAQHSILNIWIRLNTCLNTHLSLSLSLSRQLLSNLYSQLMLCTASDTSEFWHIQNLVYPGIFRYIQPSSALLRHIHICWGIFKAYLGLFRNIQHPA